MTKFFLGLVTNGDGLPRPEEGYVTYGKSSLPDDEDGEIMIRGKDASRIAAQIVETLNAATSKD